MIEECVEPRPRIRPTDATLSQRDGAVYVSFDRQRQNFATAVVSAIRTLERLGLRVDRVVADELVTPSEITARIGRSRESIRMLIDGECGPGKFPPPAEVVGRQRFWGWRDVGRWFAEYDQREYVLSSFDAFVAAVNGLLRPGERFISSGQIKPKRSASCAREEALAR